jgi:thioredoxin-dependent peroxiredoxin
VSFARWYVRSIVVVVLAAGGCHRSSDLAVGQPAPAVTAVTHDGAAFDLRALKGKPVVVYFYPKDETPGCTKEACAFRDAWRELAKTDVVLVGVSSDTDDSHRAFVQHYGLPFRLISDPQGKLAAAFGVPNRAGILARQTIVVGRDGTVRKIYREVDVTKHAAEVLADVSS